jgi:hypothetical protein
MWFIGAQPHLARNGVDPWSCGAQNNSQPRTSKRQDITLVVRICRERLGGLQSSRLGVKTLRGDLENFGPQDYLNCPEHSTSMPPDFHAAVDMQERRGVL